MDLFHTDETPQHVCWDRKHYATYEDNLAALKGSKTIYVGNLSFFTTESQIQEIFSAVGPLKRIIMGLNQLTKTPCGFCFVEYFTVQQAQACLKYISGTICDNRQIRCDIDTGFKPGRQFGRGASGGQIRDERRQGHDKERGEVRNHNHFRNDDDRHRKRFRRDDRRDYGGGRDRDRYDNRRDDRRDSYGRDGRY